MNKEELLQELYIKLNTGEISPEEIVTSFNLIPTSQQSIATSEKDKKFTPFSITKMLYVLGAAIVAIGVIIFVSQIWYDIGSFGRIVVTLGLGMLATAIGSALLKSKPDDNIGNVFHAIGGLLIPGGALVTLSELSNEVFSFWPVTITFAVIFMFYLLLNYVHKSPILTFFSIANGTAFIYSFIQSVVETSSSYYFYRELYSYITMIIGISYILLAYAFRYGWNKPLIAVLNFFGIIGFLGAAFSQVFDSVLWQLIYFILVFGSVYLSIYLKSRSILIISTLFLIVHISYITGKYFANSLGWPISLVFLGFVFIGLGYASVNINKKYIAN
jgi:hypothetical protein